jgi:hypothetical protein
MAMDSHQLVFQRFFDGGSHRLTRLLGKPPGQFMCTVTFYIQSHGKLQVEKL